MVEANQGIDTGFIENEFSGKLKKENLNFILELCKDQKTAALTLQKRVNLFNSKFPERNISCSHMWMCKGIS